MKKKCPFCGLDPYEYVDVGIGGTAIAVNCCKYGHLLYERGWSYRKVKAYQIFNQIFMSFYSWFWLVMHRLIKRAPDKGDEFFEDIPF